MATQESMLKKIRESLSDVKASEKKPTLPDVPEVWHTEGLSLDEQAKRFKMNLETVSGEVVSCETLNDAIERIVVLLKETDSRKLAILNRPLSRSVADRLSDKELCFDPENAADASDETLARMDAAIVSPEFLLADTGSCFFAAPTAFDRLTTYITPLSIVVASASMLRENLPQAWGEIKSRVANAKTGEFVIVTGPSRTADIEKILILGVHGPKRLVVFLVPDA